MIEIQKCRKCGKVFSEVYRTGPSMIGIGIWRHADEKICPVCGGPVIWVDERGVPLSPYKRMEEAKRHLRLGCFWAIVAIIGLIIYFVVIKFIK